MTTKQFWTSIQEILILRKKYRDRIEYLEQHPEEQSSDGNDLWNNISRLQMEHDMISEAGVSIMRGDGL